MGRIGGLVSLFDVFMKKITIGANPIFKIKKTGPKLDISLQTSIIKIIRQNINSIIVKMIKKEN